MPATSARGRSTLSPRPTPSLSLNDPNMLWQGGEDDSRVCQISILFHYICLVPSQLTVSLPTFCNIIQLVLDTADYLCGLSLPGLPVLPALAGMDMLCTI